MNIIAFSLWGTEPKYNVGAIRNAETYTSFLPGWSLFVYHDDTVPKDTLKALIDLEVELINAKNYRISPYMWRFLANDIAKCDRWISRDCDSRPSEREAVAVAEWVSSDAPVHIIRDHPGHCQDWPILAGLFGMKKGFLRDMAYLLTMYRQPDQGYLIDQNFLRDVVWPRARDVALQHDSFSNIGKRSQRKALPSLKDNHFIGLRFDENEQPNQQDIDSLPK